MGEYALYEGERIKIGSCEEMFWLRAEQADLVTPVAGSVDPVKHRGKLLFRFPFPDEDGTAPGSFEDTFRRQPLVRYCPPCDHPGRAGLAYQQYHGNILVVVVRCEVCRKMWRLTEVEDAQSVAAALHHLADVQIQADDDEGAVRLRSTADRVVAGYVPPDEPSGPLITIRHTPAEGTLVEGSRKGDGVWDVLKAQRANWKWSREIGLYLGQSRDKAAKGWVIEAAATALREAGFEVTVVIDEDATRSFADAEAERYQRADDRVARFEGYAEGAAGRSHAAWARSNEIAGRFEFGQPILVGHHSERRARADQRRMHDAMSRSVAEDNKAGHWAERAEAAGEYRDRRESVPTTLRRIEGLQAAERSWTRALNGQPDSLTLRNRETDDYMPAEGKYLERVKRELDRIGEELAYWRAHVKRMEAEQGVKVWGPDDFTVGDFAQLEYGYYEVLRVNKKSLTIPALISDGPVVTKANSRLSWTDTRPYSKVKGRKSAEEIARILAEVERREAEKTMQEPEPTASQVVVHQAASYSGWIHRDPAGICSEESGTHRDRSEAAVCALCSLITDWNKRRDQAQQVLAAAGQKQETSCQS